MQMIDKNICYMYMHLVVNRENRSAFSVNNGAFFQCFSVLIDSYEYAQQGSKFFTKQFSMFYIAHLSKFFVNFNWLSLVVCFMASFVLSFFPLDVWMGSGT